MAQVAIIAGAAAETGDTTALALAEAGFDVALFDADEAACAATARRVEECGRRAVVVATELTDPAAVEAAVEKVCAEMGDPLVLVTIGAAASRGPVLSSTSGEWDTTTAAVLRAAFAACQAVLNPMIMSGGGRIVVVADGPHTGNATVRTGLEGFARTLALELEPMGISANVVTAARPPDELGTADRNPETTSFSEQAARAVTMLADAAAVTGQVLRV